MTIRIGTSERDGTFHSQGRALGDHPGAPAAARRRSRCWNPIPPASTTPSGCTPARSNSASWPRTGSAAPSAAKPRSIEPVELRMAAPMNAGPLFFIARAGAPIRSVSDLRGQRVAVGLRTSGMVQHVHAIFGALGLSFADFTPVYLDFAAGADALAAGEVDAQFQCPIPNQVMTDLASRIDLRVLPYAPGQIETVMQAVPHYRATVMRKHAIRGLEAGRGPARRGERARHPRARARAGGPCRGGGRDQPSRRARPPQPAVRRSGGFVRAAALSRAPPRSSSAACRSIPARCGRIARRGW